jgi:hypothetical protein
MVTGKNPDVIHEYYGFGRDTDAAKRDGNQFYRNLALTANRSAGEVLNTCFFSCIYEYLHFNEETQCLAQGQDPSDTTLTWLGID